MEATTPIRNGHRNEGLKTWLKLMNASISAVEQTVWQGRELAEQALDTMKAVGQGADLVKAEYQQVARDLEQWKDQVARLKTTGGMLARITSSYRLWGIRSAFISRRRYQEKLDLLHGKNARLFRDVSLQQGGAFLKVGQLLSARGDILPSAWVEELRVLQDQAKPESFESVRAVIESEFNDRLENLFMEFDADPIAAASIGQVHRARLKDGKEVAVKIQRPGLEQVIKLDMSLLKTFMKSIESMLPTTDLDTITAELERTIYEELDYRQEATWMTRVGEFLKNVPGLVVPKVVQELSSEKVMTSCFIKGKPLSITLNEYKDSGEHDKMSDLLSRLLDLYLRQVLQAGVFQADPHPGNFLVTENQELVLLDFGCTMELSDEFREGYGKVLGAAMLDERDTMAEVIMNMGFETRSGRPDTLLAFSDALLGQMKKVAENMSQGEMVWTSQEDFLNNAKALMDQATMDPVDKIPAEFIMLARVFSTLGGLFTHYKPTIDVNRHLIPHLVGPALSQVF